MFAEDLLRDLRRDGYAPQAVVTYVRRIGGRVVSRLPRHAELVRSVAATSLVLFAVQFGGALLLSWAYGRSVGVAYLVASSAVLLVGSFWVLTHIGLAHSSRDGQPMRRIPFPVALTLLRLVAIPAIVLLIQNRAWHAVVWLFAVAASTDVIDGVLARALGSESRVGSVLDPLVDIAFNSSVFIALAAGGELPWWVAGLMLARYGFLVGGTFYLYVFRGPVRIQPTGFGKLTGVLTTVLVGLLLLGLASWSNATRLRLKEVFDVGLGVLAFATIIQVLFIGLANKKSLEREPVADDLPRTGKVVGDVRWPRR
jgi:phosphatidylglycerophosphate synthase